MNRPIKAISVQLLFAFILILTAQAEPPPEWYERARQRATEHLNVQVFRIEQTKFKGSFEIEAEAEAEVEITKVHHSESGLSTGDIVVIKYKQHSKGTPMRMGPSCPPTLLIEEAYQVGAIQ